jgi:hypothetical protein
VHIYSSKKLNIDREKHKIVYTDIEEYRISFQVSICGIRTQTQLGPFESRENANLHWHYITSSDDAFKRITGLEREMLM